MRRHLLVDGDLLAFRFAVAAETKVEWEPGQFSSTANLNDARAAAHNWLKHVSKKLNADSYLFCFSCPTRRYFRHDVFPEYKLDRTHGPVPMIRSEVRAMMEADFPSKSKPGLEADDVMGILSTWKGYLPNHEKIIVSSDKDMATIPGLHFNHDKDNEPRFITQQQADYTHLRQTLTGDTCDGYKGCPGVGPVRADRFLASPTASSANTSSAGSAAKDVRLWDRVVSVFNSKGLTEADALVQARLARILRAEDYDFVNQTVKLWTPSTTDSK